MTATDQIAGSNCAVAPISPAALRVAVVSDSTAERNGVGSYYADLIEQLQPRVARAELICPEPRSDWHRYLAPPLPGDATQKIWLPRPLKLLSRLSRLKPHVIVVPTPGPFGILGLIAAMRYRVPLVVGFHTSFDALANIYWGDAFGRICRLYLTWCNRLLFQHSALVLANSPDMARQAERMGARFAELMGTSLPNAFISRPLTPLRPEVRRILFVGRLAEEKNIPKIIDVARARPELAVSIAGDGPLKQQVVDAAAEIPNLSYLGWVARSEVIDVVDDHDLMLLPSQVESFGTVALEAMARGRLVLVSEACGITEWPQMMPGLFTIGADETAVEAVDRVVALPFEDRQDKARRAHRAARDLHERNVRDWIDWLLSNGRAYADTD